MEELRQFLAHQNEVSGAILDRMAAPQAEAQNPRSSQPVPQPPPLCLDGDMEQNFDFFKRNWENYASAIGMDQWPAEDESKKVGYLLSVIGFEALRKYFNFQLTDEQRRTPVVALAAIKEKVVRPRNMNLDLLEFFSVKQELETIDEFHTKLKVLAKPCQLGELEERFITYKVVTANKWPHLRKRLTTNSEITLEKAVNECRLEEVSAKRIQELGCERSNEVNKIESKKERREKREEKKCKFCGGRHVFEKGSFPAYGQKCRRCRKKNHFEKMCPNRKCEKREKKKIKEVLKNVDTSDSSESYETSASEESEFPIGIPIPATNLLQKVVEGVPEAIMKNRQKIKYNYDKRARQLPELEIGSPVYVQARPQSSKVWSPGVISNKLSDRSYVVNVDGTNYRRDAVNIKSRKEPAAPFVPTGSSTVEGSKSSTVPVNLYQTPSAEFAVMTEEPVQTSNVAETESAANQSSNDVNIHSTSEKMLSSPKSRDRPKREIRLPAKYKDFIVS